MYEENRGLQTQSATQLKDGDALLYEIAVYLFPSNGLFSVTCFGIL